MLYISLVLPDSLRVRASPPAVEVTASSESGARTPKWRQLFKRLTEPILLLAPHRTSSGHWNFDLTILGAALFANYLGNVRIPVLSLVLCVDCDGAKRRVFESRRESRRINTFTRNMFLDGMPFG